MSCITNLAVSLNSFIGPLAPRDSLEYSKKKLEEYQNVTLECIRNSSKFGFVNSSMYDELLLTAIKLQENKFYLDQIAKRELLWLAVEQQKILFNNLQHSRRAELFDSHYKLPPLSIYNSENMYNNLNLEDDCVEIQPSEEVEYCEYCNSWTIDPNHICNNNFKLKTINKTKINKFIGNLNDNNKQLRNKIATQCYIPIKRVKIFCDLTHKYKLILETFENLRKKDEIRFKYFAAIEQLNLYYECKHLGYSTVIDIVNRILEYENNKDYNEPIELAKEALELMDLDQLDEVKYLTDEEIEEFIKNSTIECQMDREEAHGDCDELKKEQQQNVILTTHAEESIADPLTITQDIWEKLCSPQNIQEYSQLMSRWQVFDSVEWSPSAINNTVIKRWSLPKDFIKNCQNSPNCLIFKQYAYFRSDLEIKIVVNTNKFHCGSLQASFYYGASTDLHYKDRLNIYSASQMTHAIIDAASASDCILKIPYRHYKPLMGTFDTNSDKDVLNLGELRLFILNRLRTPVSDTNKIDVNLFIRFVNPSFHGMKPRDLVENQMMGMASLVKETANLVQQIYPDSQRDNPSDVVPPKPIIPWSANSWCLGDLTPEPINPLRMQATGNTPHPPGTLPKEPEMDVAYVSRIFGLVKQVEWNTTQLRGTNLLTMPFSPVWDIEDYPSISCANPDNKTCYVMPPVSIISELFAWWRGSMEYKFDFISTQFHTGRLIIAYIPRSKKINNPTIAQLTSCDHVVVDLREERQVNYINAFLSDLPWWTRRRRVGYSAEKEPPGYIYVSVLVRLTATNAVSNSIAFNVYMRGGEDLEFQIPVNPHIALSYNTKVLENSFNDLTTAPGYGPPTQQIYIGMWHSTGNGLVFRYGPTSDHITQFLVDKQNHIGKVFEFSQPVALKHPNYQTSLNFLVPFTDGSYWYGAPFDTYERARMFLKVLDKNNKSDFSDKTNGMMLQSGGKSDGDYISNLHTFYWKIYSVKDFYFVNSVPTVINNAGDEERTKICGEDLLIQKRIKSTGKGLLTFGEKIYSLKQLIRRYAPYAQYIRMTSSRSDPALADFVVPILPQGLDLMLFKDLNRQIEFEYGNRLRDGPIAIIASGYRFYRGSVRFRFIVDGATEGCFWVQHRPEYNLRSTSLHIPDYHYSEALFQPGYASMFQFTSLNNVIEVEVPFYLPGQFGMLQRPDLTQVEDAVHYSMGALYCGFDTMRGSPSNTQVICQIMYSMGDDMSFSVFQGFPAVFSTEEFSNSQIEQQGLGDWMEDKLSNVFTRTINKTVDKILDPPNQIRVEAQVHNLATDKSPPASTLEKIVTAVTNEAIKPSNEDQEHSAKSKINSINDIYTLIEQNISDLPSDKKQLIMGVITNLIHSLINPELKQVAWSIASVFCQMGIVAIDYLSRFWKVLERFLGSINNLLKRAKKSEQAPNTVVSNGPDEYTDEDLRCEAAFVSTCVTGILAACGASKKPLPKTLPNFAQYLYEGMPKFTLTANGIFIFLKNNLKMFKKMWYWIVAYFKKDYIIYKELHEASDEVLTFIRRIQWCLDERNKSRIISDPKATLQVYECANIASSYLAKRAVSKITKPMPLFDSFCKKIIALRDELVLLMISPAIRFEPFVICLQGPPNVGKSHLAQTLARELLASINYKSYDDLVYTRTPGVAYWNGLRNQPVCLFDDFLNIADPNFALPQLGELFCLKSKAVFNPPMAAIEEKKIRYNPLIVFLCCNEPFPEIKGVAVESAWMRRRDIMFHVATQYPGKSPRSLDKNLTKDYKHLNFYPFDSPAGELPREPNMNAKMSYSEFLPKLIERFGEYFQEECEQYDNAVQKIRTFYPDAEVSTEDYVKEIEKKIEEVNLDPRRVLPDDLDQINNSIKMLKDNTMASDMEMFARKKLIEGKIKKIEIEKNKILIPQRSDTSVIVGELEQLNGVVIPPMTFNTDDLIQFEREANLIIEEKRQRTLAGTIINNMAGDNSSDSSTDEEDDNCYCKILRQGKLVSLSVSPTNKVLNINMQSPIRSIVKIDYNGLEKQTCKLCATRIYEIFKKNYPNFNSVPDCNLPPRIAEFRKLELEIVIEKKGDTVPLMSTEEIDDLLVKEVVDPTWYEKLWSKVPGFGKIWGWLVKLGAIFVTLGMVIRFAGYLFSSADKFNEQRDAAKASALEASSHRSRWEDTVKTVIGGEQSSSYSTGVIGKKVDTSGATIPIKAVAQSSEQQLDIINNKIIRNTFWLIAEFKDELGQSFKKSFKCLGLCGHYFLLLDHYIFFLKSKFDVKLYFVHAFRNQSTYYQISNSCLEKLQFLRHSALVIGTIDKQIPAFANIIKFFMRSSSSANLAPQASLFEYKYDEAKQSFLMNHRSFNRINRRNRVDVKNDDGSTSMVSVAYSYGYGGRGVCGSVLCTDSNSPYPIIGIHVAGKVDCSEGYAEAVVYESFAHLLDEDVPEIVENSALSLNFSEKPIMELDGNVLQYGTIPRHMACYPPNKSRIVPTVCANQITEVTYDVPLLSAKDPRIENDSFSPLLEGCKFHTNPCLAFPDNFVDRSIEDVKNLLLAHVQPQRLEVGKLTYEQAICGIPENPLYEPIAMDTSEGFPWILDRPNGCSNKSWLFKRTLTNNGFILDEINKKLFEHMEANDALRRNGQYPMTIFVDCLKDAKLPKEKVLDRGKTRIFSISPVDFTIQQRQYSLDFTVAYQHSRRNCETAVGIDIYSIETNDLVERMMAFSDKFICGDYSKFGDQLYARLIQAVYEIIYEWYKLHGKVDSDFGKVLKCFSYEVSYAFHLMLNQLYRSMGGMPSGNPLTVIINSCVNSMYVRIIWQLIMYRYSVAMLDMKSFNDNVKLVTYGDDIWMAVKEDVIHVFNGVSISEEFAKYNIKFTNASKSGTLIPYSKIDSPETTFLKCTFHRHEFRANLWYARLEKRVVEETCNWCWNTNSDLEACSIEACSAMLELAYGHGKEYHSKLREKVILFWRDKGVKITIPDWDSIDLRIYG